MIQETRLKQLQELISTSTKDELIWMNGYLNGIVSGNTINTNASENKSAVVKKISLLFGTETGNSKTLATQFALAAKKQGIVTKLVGLDQYRLTDLPKEEYLFLVVSTHGEGEPPESAKKFYDHIHQSTLSLSNTKFGILGLGDLSYPLFCKTGEDIDAQLEKLGATRIIPLQKCDVDYEAEATLWFDQVLAILNQSENKISTEEKISSVIPIPQKKGKYFYNGTIVANINLNDEGSNKETYHIEITTEEKIDYLAGDALALIPKNKVSIVDNILSLTGANPDVEITTAKQQDTLRNLLINNLNICYLLSSTIKKYATIVGHDIPDVRMDLLDLLNIYPVKDIDQFYDVVKILTSIAPRLYTICSSPKVHETEVHIIVRRDEFMSKEDKGYGLCSNQLRELPVQSSIQFYIHQNKHFKLPENDADIIMIGPGTGIAPFRAFLSERDAIGSKGKNWLFFGEHNFQKDFLYQTELQNFLKTDVLQKISLAFSRDQKEKVYVQHKILEQGEEFYSWIKNGASVYLSGTKDPMSIDVEKSILQLLEQHGKMSAVDAKSYWEEMRKQGRYQKEVY